MGEEGAELRADCSVWYIKTINLIYRTTRRHRHVGRSRVHVCGVLWTRPNTTVYVHRWITRLCCACVWYKNYVKQSRPVGRGRGAICAKSRIYNVISFCRKWRHRDGWTRMYGCLYIYLYMCVYLYVCVQLIIHSIDLSGRPWLPPPAEWALV